MAAQTSRVLPMSAHSVGHSWLCSVSSAEETPAWEFTQDLSKTALSWLHPERRRVGTRQCDREGSTMWELCLEKQLSMLCCDKKCSCCLGKYRERIIAKKQSLGFQVLLSGRASSEVSCTSRKVRENPGGKWAEYH